MRAHLIRLIAIILVAFSHAFPPAPAQTRVDTTISMSDGVKLEGFYMLPEDTPPAAGWPAILFVHGFNGDMNDNLALAQDAAAKGYASVSYSVRGQGASEGTFDFFTSERLRLDLADLIAFTKSLPGVRADRVAVDGGSQGGIIAWSAAAYDLGVRAVISAVANGRFDEDWTENNALNWTFARAVNFATARLAPELRALVNDAVNSGDNTAVEAMLRGYSTRSLETAVTTPVAMFIACQDGFFNQSAALRQFARIPSPKHIMTYPAGHTIPPSGNMRDEYWRQVDAWHAYWLKDDPAAAWIVDPASAVWVMDGSTGAPHVFAAKDSAYWLTAPLVLPAGLARWDLYLTATGLSETLPSPQSQRTFSYTNMLGSDIHSFRSEPVAVRRTLAGTQGRVVLQADGTGTQYQFSVYVFDTDPATGKSLPIVRGHAQVVNNTIGSETLMFDLTSAMHTIEAGHVLEVKIHSGMGFLPNTTVDFGNYVLGPVFGSTNTLILGGSEPSRMTLYTYDSAAVTSTARVDAPAEFRLEQNHPNPFNPSTSISFNVHAGVARLSIHGITGAEVARLVDGELPAGLHTARWDAAAMPSGVYFCRLEQSGRIAVRPMVLLR